MWGCGNVKYQKSRTHVFVRCRSLARLSLLQSLYSLVAHHLNVTQYFAPTFRLLAGCKERVGVWRYDMHRV